MSIESLIDENGVLRLPEDAVLYGDYNFITCDAL